MKRAYRCASCGADPDERELERIHDDLFVRRPGGVQPAGWLCPRCAPELEQACSGLFFDVVEVGGSSPEHEYGSES